VLKKEIDNGFVKETVNTDLIYLKDDARYLTESAINGDDKETGTISKECGLLTFEKDIFIKHNEGKFDLKNCSAEKKITFANPLDCVASKEINIFDYAGGTTETIQGDSEIKTVFKKTIVNVPFDEPIIQNSASYAMPLNEAINYLAQQFLLIQTDFSNEGYFVKYRLISIEPLYEFYSALDENGNSYYIENYKGHELKEIVVWQRIKSLIKYSDLWLQIPGETGYYLPLEPIEFKAPEIFTRYAEGPQITLPYNYVNYKAGTQNTLRPYLSLRPLYSLWALWASFTLWPLRSITTVTTRYN